MPENKDRLTLGTTATPYECCGFLDLCTDADLMSLSFAGVSPFLDWLTWRPTNVCEIRKWFLTWVRPERVLGACTDGVVADPCGDAEGVDWGGCGFELRNFGRLRRQGPVRDITMNGVKYCEIQPRYRLDGSPINDTRELDMRMVMEALMQDVQKQIVLGHTTSDGDGNFDGLQQSIKTNYHDPSGRRCTSMDSVIIDWNHNTLAGGAGITWNGVAQGANWDFVDVLRAVIRNVKQRIAWSPQMAGRALRVGDIVLMMPTFLTSCLLAVHIQQPHGQHPLCPSAAIPLDDLWLHTQSKQPRFH